MNESAHEKIERYRRMADSTRDLAARTEDPLIRAAYLDLAEKWVSLANETAHEANSGGEPNSERAYQPLDQMSS